MRRGVALTAVLAGVVVGATALSAETSDEPVVARTAASTTDVVLPTPNAAELARLAESRGDERLSRSGGRAADPAKAQALRAEARPGPQESRTRTVELGDPREIAQAMLADYGWSSSEFGCLDSLWVKESGWDPQAANPTSSAYGIPQALPGSKMASAGADWETNPATQIEWGLGYIAERYGSPCSAWSHSQANGWY
ncbi:lytic transglycosylase domain-containing protein [Nocardioides sp. HDW12B]|nr:lytic transglycosylase domain-containing protein [Nocardioides sp. HDW12B]